MQPQTAWIALTPAMSERMFRHAAAAIERLEAFGRDDRRESAFALILAAAAPMAGMLLLDWEVSAVIAALWVNLLLGLTDDIVKLIRSHGRWIDVSRAALADTYVWTVARAMARGSRTVYGKGLPDEGAITRGESPVLVWWVALMAYLTAGLCLLLLHGPGAARGSGNLWFVATLPSLLMLIGFSVFHAINHHAHWRLAGSVRLQTTVGTASFIAGAAGFQFIFISSPHGPPLGDDGIALLTCLAAIAFAACRLFALSRMGAAAAWLKRSPWLREQAQLRAAERGPAADAGQPPEASV
jgi:hypothetical protein